MASRDLGRGRAGHTAVPRSSSPSAAKPLAKRLFELVPAHAANMRPRWRDSPGAATLDARNGQAVRYTAFQAVRLVLLPALVVTLVVVIKHGAGPSAGRTAMRESTAVLRPQREDARL